MPRQSSVYEVLIASPSDVIAERRVLAEVVEDWNSANSRLARYLASGTRWELDGVPASGGRPQEILNKQLVERADVLMAVFGTRLGTPTRRAPSGTAEEIEHFSRQGKPVLLYFSEADIPHNHDAEQLRLLKEYRRSLRGDTFYQTFQDAEGLRRRATRDLTNLMNKLAASSSAQDRDKPITNKNEFARLLLMTQSQGVIPTTSVKIVRVFGTIENHAPSKRISEYTCTLSVPRCCLSFGSSTYSAEVESGDPNYRRFRYTERNRTGVPIHAGDRFQVVSIDIAVDHLAQDDQEKCLKMSVIADAEVDGEALQTRKTVAELIGV